MNCPRCKAYNDEKSSYCIMCGEPLKKNYPGDAGVSHSSRNSSSEFSGYLAFFCYLMIIGGIAATIIELVRVIKCFNFISDFKEYGDYYFWDIWSFKNFTKAMNEYALIWVIIVILIAVWSLGTGINLAKGKDSYFAYYLRAGALLGVFLLLEGIWCSVKFGNYLYLLDKTFGTTRWYVAFAVFALFLLVHLFYFKNSDAVDYHVRGKSKHASASDMGESALASMAREREEENVLRAGGWKCRGCGKVNAAYVGTCPCGKPKTQNDKEKAEAEAYKAELKQKQNAMQAEERRKQRAAAGIKEEYRMLKDQNGRTCFADSEGNIFYVDENGLPYYINSKGYPYYLDAKGQAYYHDVNGRKVIYDLDGNPQYPK